MIKEAVGRLFPFRLGVLREQQFPGVLVYEIVPGHTIAPVIAQQVHLLRVIQQICSLPFVQSRAGRGGSRRASGSRQQAQGAEHPPGAVGK